jgi:hypothetical protein
MRFVIIVPILLVSSIAAAHDSTWLLCRDGKTHSVASVHEHRAKSGDAREFSITWISGDHVAKGTPDTKGATKLRDLEGKHAVVFDGTAKLAPDMTRLVLAGTNDWIATTKPTKLDVELVCEVVAD